MKINYLIVLCSIIFSPTIFAQLGIKETNSVPNSKAMLDIESTSKGVLIPRLTTTQRNAIASPPAGLMVYNSTVNKYNYFNGSVWSEFVVGGFTLPFSASTNFNDKAFQIINSNTTDIYSAAINGIGVSGNGVEGISETGSGVKGESYSGIGVYGSTISDTSPPAIAIKGVNISTGGVSIQAFNFGANGTALEIAGPVKVSGSNKFVFVHNTTVANKISANGTDIDNVLCNNDPLAFLIVSYRVSSTSGVYNNSPIGTNYNVTRNKWEIVNQNGAAIPTGAQFNVMVIKQ